MLDTLSPRRARTPVLGDLVAGSMIRDLAIVVGLAAFVGLFAQISIVLPFTPVPITGQTFAVLLGGMAVGTRRAAAGMLLYVAIGLLGVPWFAGGSGGTAIISDPSFGYILGFLVAAAALGALAGRGFDRRPELVLAAMVAGNLVIYLFGATWLAIDLHLSAARAVSLGVTPFLLGDAIKALCAMGLLPTAWRLVGRSGRGQ